MSTNFGTQHKPFYYQVLNRFDKASDIHVLLSFQINLSSATPQYFNKALAMLFFCISFVPPYISIILASL